VKTKRLNLLTSRRWTYVLAKPRRRNAREVFHIADWRWSASGLCGVDLVVFDYPVRRSLPDGSTTIVMVPDEDGRGYTNSFTTGNARRAFPTEATCRRCRSILRHLSARALPMPLVRELAYEEYAERERAATRAARKQRTAVAERPVPASSASEGTLFTLPAPTGKPAYRRPRTAAQWRPAARGEQLALFAA
jgi:hypothetical protein